MNEKRILIVTKNLLDMSDAQSQQSFALINALSDSGYSLDIVTAKSRVSSSDKLPALRNIRLFVLPASWHAYGNSLVQKIQRKLYRSMASIIQSKWSSNAARIISELCKENDYSAIISIALPMESHLAVFNTNIRPQLWIACMSDPWPESILPRPYADFSIPLVSLAQKKVVGKVLQSADHLVFTCKEQLDFMKRHYSFISETNSSVIPHIASIFQISARKNHGEFVITHCGSLSRERVCPGLASALSMLPDRSAVVINFIGNVNEEMKHEFERNGVSDRIKYTGSLDKERAMEMASESDALLLIEADMQEYPFLPSKLADYSAASLPIMAITGENSASAKLILSHNCGVICGHDPNAILNAILSIETGKFRPSSELHDYFCSVNVAEMYEIILHSRTPGDSDEYNQAR
jgi:glycosyltransferase involved in cell wall biosynthesis